MKNSKFIYLICLSLITACTIKPQNQAKTNNNSVVSKTDSPPTTSTIENVYQKDGNHSTLNRNFYGPKSLMADMQDKYLGEAEQTAISAKGNYTTFVSTEVLVPEAPAKVLKVYGRQLNEDSGTPTGPIELLSRRSAMSLTNFCGTIPFIPVPANGDSYSPAISGNGNVIAYVSEAKNLAVNIKCSEDMKSAEAVPEDKMAVTSQIYVYNRLTGQTRMISGELSSHGYQIAGYSVYGTPSVSQDGTTVAFSVNNRLTSNDSRPKESDQYTGIFIYNLITDKSAFVSFSEDPTKTQIDGDSWQPSLNQDGTSIVFTSCDRLVSQDKTIGLTDECVEDVYLARFAPDPKGGPNLDGYNNGRVHLELVSTDNGFSSNESSGHFKSSLPSISADGRYVVFQSQKPIKQAVNGWVPNDSRPVLYNDKWSIYMKDVINNKISLVSANYKTGNFIYSEYNSSDPVISPDGRYVMFVSQAPDVYQTPRMWEFVNETKLKPPVTVPNTNNSCANLLLRAYEDFSKLEGSTWTLPTGASYGGTAKGGWRNALQDECAPEIWPETYGKKQVYVVEIDLGTLQPKKMAPVSVTEPLIMAKLLTTPSNAMKVVLPDGKTRFVHKFTDWKAAMFADNDATTCGGTSSRQLMSEWAKVIAFCSSAHNLNGSFAGKYEEMGSSFRRPDGYFFSVPPSDVLYSVKVVTRDGVSADSFDPYSPYYRGFGRTWRTWIYTPSNPMTYNVETAR